MNFIGCESAFDDAKAVLFGAPFDSTTSYRPGARFGASAIRHESRPRRRRPGAAVRRPRARARGGRGGGAAHPRGGQDARPARRRAPRHPRGRPRRRRAVRRTPRRPLRRARRPARGLPRTAALARLRPAPLPRHPRRRAHPPVRHPLRDARGVRLRGCRPRLPGALRGGDARVALASGRDARLPDGRPRRPRPVGVPRHRHAGGRRTPVRDAAPGADGRLRALPRRRLRPGGARARTRPVRTLHRPRRQAAQGVSAGQSERT